MTENAESLRIGGMVPQVSLAANSLSPLSSLSLNPPRPHGHHQQPSHDPDSQQSSGREKSTATTKRSRGISAPYLSNPSKSYTDGKSNSFGNNWNVNTSITTSSSAGMVINSGPLKTCRTALSGAPFPNALIFAILKSSSSAIASTAKPICDEEPHVCVGTPDGELRIYRLLPMEHFAYGRNSPGDGTDSCCGPASASLPWDGFSAPVLDLRCCCKGLGPIAAIVNARVRDWKRTGRACARESKQGADGDDAGDNAYCERDVVLAATADGRLHVIDPCSSLSISSSSSSRDSDSTSSVDAKTQKRRSRVSPMNAALKATLKIPPSASSMWILSQSKCLKPKNLLSSSPEKINILLGTTDGHIHDLIFEFPLSLPDARVQNGCAKRAQLTDELAMPVKISSPASSLAAPPPSPTAAKMAQGLAPPLLGNKDDEGREGKRERVPGDPEPKSGDLESPTMTGFEAWRLRKSAKIKVPSGVYSLGAVMRQTGKKAAKGSGRPNPCAEVLGLDGFQGLGLGLQRSLRLEKKEDRRFEENSVRFSSPEIGSDSIANRKSTDAANREMVTPRQRRLDAEARERERLERQMDRYRSMLTIVHSTCPAFNVPRTSIEATLNLKSSPLASGMTPSKATENCWNTTTAEADSNERQEPEKERQGKQEQNKKKKDAKEEEEPRGEQARECKVEARNRNEVGEEKNKEKETVHPSDNREEQEDKQRQQRRGQHRPAEAAYRLYLGLETTCVCFDGQTSSVTPLFKAPAQTVTSIPLEMSSSPARSPEAAIARHFRIPSGHNSDPMPPSHHQRRGSRGDEKQPGGQGSMHARPQSDSSTPALQSLPPPSSSPSSPSAPRRSLPLSLAPPMHMEQLGNACLVSVWNCVGGGGGEQHTYVAACTGDGQLHVAREDGDLKGGRSRATTGSGRGDGDEYCWQISEEIVGLEWERSLQGSYLEGSKTVAVCTRTGIVFLVSLADAGKVKAAECTEHAAAGVSPASATANASSSQRIDAIDLGEHIAAFAVQGFVGDGRNGGHSTLIHGGGSLRRGGLYVAAVTCKWDLVVYGPFQAPPPWLRDLSVKLAALPEVREVAHRFATGNSRQTEEAKTKSNTAEASTSSSALPPRTAVRAMLRQVGSVQARELMRYRSALRSKLSQLSSL